MIWFYKQSVITLPGMPPVKRWGVSQSLYIFMYGGKKFPLFMLIWSCSYQEKEPYVAAEYCDLQILAWRKADTQQFPGRISRKWFFHSIWGIIFWAYRSSIKTHLTRTNLSHFLYSYSRAYHHRPAYPRDPRDTGYSFDGSGCPKCEAKEIKTLGKWENYLGVLGIKSSDEVWQL